MAQPGKALSCLAEAYPRAFGELSTGLMAAPASEAGGEAQEELLPTISTPTASSSRGVDIGSIGRRLAELSLAVWAVDEAAQTRKALSSPAEGGRSRRAFGEPTPGLIARLASEEEGGEPQEEILSIVSTPTACSHGESRFANLWRRLAEVRAAAYAAEAELNAIKREPEKFDRENRSQAAIAASHIQALHGTVLQLQDDMMKFATNLEKWWEMPTLFDQLMQLQDVKGHSYRNDTTHGFDELDLLTRTFKQISLKSTEDAHEKEENYKNDITESEGSLKDLASRVENISAEFHVIKRECRKYLLYHAEVTSATPKDENVMPFDQNVLKFNVNSRHFLDTPPTSEDIGPSGMPSLNGEHERESNKIMESAVGLKHLVDKGINIRGKEFKNKWFQSDDESSSTSTRHSDFDDEILNLLAETRQPNYRHMPPDDFSLPEISSLDLPFQFPSNQEMSGITSSSNSSRSSNNSSDDQTRLDEDDDIYSDRGIIGIATDEEEEVLLAEASICVADDLEAVELIVRHDEEEVFSQLGMMTAVRTDGVPRDILIDLQIVFFGKEKNATTCAICISEFDTTDRCIRLPCKHIFHFRCIIEWLLANSTCPVCRESLSNSDEHVNRSSTIEVLGNGESSSASPPGSGTIEVLDNADNSSASAPGSGTTEMSDDADSSASAPGT